METGVIYVIYRGEIPPGKAVDFRPFIGVITPLINWRGTLCEHFLDLRVSGASVDVTPPKMNERRPKKGTILKGM